MEANDIISVSTDEIICKKCSFSSSLVTNFDVTTPFSDIEQYVKRSDIAIATTATAADNTKPFSDSFDEGARFFETLDP